MRSKLLQLSIAAIALLSVGQAHAQISKTGLIAQWSFNNNAIDSTGNGHDGTEHDITYTASRYGKPNGAASFNGLSSFITVPYTSKLNLSKYSICATVKIRGFYAGNCQVNTILQRGMENSTGEYGMRYSDTDGNCGTIDTNKFTLTTMIGPNDNNVPHAGWRYSPVLHTGEWYSFVATFDSTNIKVYINGVLRGTNFSTNLVPIGSSMDGAFIGAGYSGAATPSMSFPYWFNGYMDDLRIYGRVLSNSEITSYNTIDTPLSSSAIASVSDNINVSAYPNPSEGSFEIRGTVSAATPVTINITNSLGQIVHTEESISENGLINKRITLNNVSNGVYFVHLNTELGNKVLRIAVQRCS